MQEVRGSNPLSSTQVNGLIRPLSHPVQLSRAADRQHNTVDYSSAVQAILLPAGVSVLVTLAVEWAAKPRLGARKERILAEHREDRLLVRRIDDLQYVAGRILAHREAPAEFEERLSSLVEEGLQRVTEFGQSRAAVNMMRDDAVDYLIGTAGSGADAALVMLSHRYYDDGKAFELLDESTDLLDLLLQYLRLPGWRIGTRRRLLQRIQAENARLHASLDTSNNPEASASPNAGQLGHADY